MRHRGFRSVLPGALVGVALWLAASAVFSTYLANFKSFNVTYGSFAAAIILLVWFWLTNVALLFGAEVNAEIEHAQEIAEGVPEPDTLDSHQQTDTDHAPRPPRIVRRRHAARSAESSRVPGRLVAAAAISAPKARRGQRWALNEAPVLVEVTDVRILRRGTRRCREHQVTSESPAGLTSRLTTWHAGVRRCRNAPHGCANHSGPSTSPGRKEVSRPPSEVPSSSRPVG